ncbi:MAG: FAD:protein FMN transferase [Bacteroidales bacterium]|nr:FAD:protein FMN transferase [Bacteroidales bacterium]
MYLAALIASGCSQQPVHFFGEAQGTYYSVQYYDRHGRDLQPQVDSLLHAFDLTASLWVDSSLLRRLNANTTDSVDALFTALLEHSLTINAYTGGAFDPRIGRIVQAWGFSFRQQQEPDSTELAAMLRAARGSVSIDNGRLVKEDPATELDFNAIAQGYAVDLLAAMLERYGITNYLIDVGGEVIARGGKTDGSPWRVGIERPSADSISAPVVERAVELRDNAIVTSGSYRKYYERDGIRYSHTIDPATGRPVQHSLLSVSVVDSLCWRADAMATAYMVMGLDSAKRFIAAHPNGPGTKEVYFIYDSCGVMKTYETNK